MRDALGDDIEIMVDINQGWTVEEAIAVGKRIDPYNLSWLEEPVMADDFDRYHAIADAIETSVVGGENNFTPVQAVLRKPEDPVLQPDIMRGGYTELRIIAEHAHKAGLTMAWHMFPELSVHMTASIENPSWLEYMGWYDHLWVEPNNPKEGMMTPPDRPGLAWNSDRNCSRTTYTD